VLCGSKHRHEWFFLLFGRNKSEKTTTAGTDSLRVISDLIICFNGKIFAMREGFQNVLRQFERPSVTNDRFSVLWIIAEKYYLYTGCWFRLPCEFNGASNMKTIWYNYLEWILIVEICEQWKESMTDVNGCFFLMKRKIMMIFWPKSKWTDEHTNICWRCWRMRMMTGSLQILKPMSFGWNTLYKSKILFFWRWTKNDGIFDDVLIFLHVQSKLNSHTGYVTLFSEF
jgi:hypothetical protein